MIPIRYIQGDATRPQGEGIKVIAHICNDVGLWGAGFVLAITAEFGNEPERQYRKWQKNPPANRPFALGQIQIVPVRHDVYICNMIAQHGIKDVSGRPPISYEWLCVCLERLAAFVFPLDGVSVHMPRIGCGLAGGKWEHVEAVVSDLSENDIPVTVYDL